MGVGTQDTTLLTPGCQSQWYGPQLTGHFLLTRPYLDQASLQPGAHLESSAWLDFSLYLSLGGISWAVVNGGPLWSRQACWRPQLEVPIGSQLCRSKRWDRKCPFKETEPLQ